MRSVRVSAASLLVLSVLILAACGEKEENLDPSGNDPVLPEPQARASHQQVEGATAKSIARSEASQAVAPKPNIPPEAWKVTCDRGEAGVVTCAVSAAACSGDVILHPVKVPAGESPEGYGPRSDVSGVSCTASAAKKAQ